MILDYIILKDGLPIYTRNLDAQQGVTADQAKFTLISGFLSAISTFANSMEHLGQMQEVQMTSDIYFTFKKTSIGETEILFIVASNGDTPKLCVKELINSSAEQFLCEFETELTEKWKGNLRCFDRFNDIFDVILNDVNEQIAALNQKTQIIPPTELHAKNTENVHDVQPEIAIESEPILAAPISSVIPESNAPSTTVSTKNAPSRFDRYMLFQQMNSQSTMNQENHQYSSQIENSEEPESAPWISPDAWITKSSPNASVQQMDAPENTAKSIKYPISQSPTHSQIIQPSIPSANKQSQIVTHSGTRFVFRQPESRVESYATTFYSQAQALTQHQRYRVSVYEKIPCLQMRFAGHAESFLVDPWYKAVYNAVNGQNSIREIANKFKIGPAEVLRTCQEMAQSGLLFFQE